MNNDAVRLFRTQINGFNKDDVNQYILEIDRRHLEEQSNLLRKLDELKGQVASLEDEKKGWIDDGQGQGESLTVEDMKEWTTESQEEMQALRDSLSASKSEVEAIKKEKSGLQKELDELRGQLASLEEEKKEWTTESQEEKDSLQALRASISASKSEVEAIKKEKSGLQKELDDLRGQLASLEEEKKEWMAERQEQEESMQTLRASLPMVETEQQSDLQQELDELKEQLASLQQEKGEWIVERQAQEDSLKTLKAALSVSETEGNAAKQAAEKKNNELQKALLELTSAKNAFQKEKEALMAANQERSDALAALRIQKEEERMALEKKISDLQAELADKSAAAKVRDDSSASDADDRNVLVLNRMNSQMLALLSNASNIAEETLASARAEADKIKAEADETKAEADKIKAETDDECEKMRQDCELAVNKTREETEEEATYIRNRLSVATYDILSSASTDLHGSMDNCIREMNASITNMQEDMRKLMAELAAKTEEMNRRISSYQSRVSEGVEKKLAEMDDKYGIQCPKS